MEDDPPLPVVAVNAFVDADFIGQLIKFLGKVVLAKCSVYRRKD
jgi:hypothetical protein